MKQSESDAKLFFKLMWSVQYFANQKLQILPAIHSKTEYAALRQDNKYKVKAS